MSILYSSSVLWVRAGIVDIIIFVIYWKNIAEIDPFRNSASRHFWYKAVTTKCLSLYHFQISAIKMHQLFIMHSIARVSGSYHFIFCSFLRQFWTILFFYKTEFWWQMLVSLSKFCFVLQSLYVYECDFSVIISRKASNHRRTPLRALPIRVWIMVGL